MQNANLSADTRNSVTFLLKMGAAMRKTKLNPSYISVHTSDVKMIATEFESSAVWDHCKEQITDESSHVADMVDKSEEARKEEEPTIQFMEAATVLKKLQIAEAVK